MKTLAALAGSQLKPIVALILDVDGVLTDGSVFYSSSGEAIQRFHVRDGFGIRCWHEAGRVSAIISGRASPALEIRAKELGVKKVAMGVSEKLPAFLRILSELSLSPEACAYVGDDLPDIPVLRAAGVGIAVADAAREVKESAACVTVTPGGRGAVREVVEALLRAQGKWESILASFGGPGLG